MDPSPVYATIDRLRHTSPRPRSVRDDAAPSRRCRPSPRRGTPHRAPTHALDGIATIGQGVAARLGRAGTGEGHPGAREPGRQAGPARTRRAEPPNVADPADARDRLLRHRRRAGRLRRRPGRLRTRDRRADASCTDYLDARLPPPWFEGRIPDPSTWPLRISSSCGAATARRHDGPGIAVSGGQASGPARVIVDPADPRGLQPGEVLVCAITDPSWTPLFLGAAAVVCDVGDDARAMPRSSPASWASPLCSACPASPGSPTARCCTSTARTGSVRIG